MSIYCHKWHFLQEGCTSPLIADVRRQPVSIWLCTQQIYHRLWDEMSMFSELWPVVCGCWCSPVTTVWERGSWVHPCPFLVRKFRGAQFQGRFSHQCQCIPKTMEEMMQWETTHRNGEGHQYGRALIVAFFASRPPCHLTFQLLGMLVNLSQVSMLVCLSSVADSTVNFSVVCLHWDCVLSNPCNVRVTWQFSLNEPSRDLVLGLSHCPNISLIA
jgi:hypothetical protein